MSILLPALINGGGIIKPDLELQVDVHVSYIPVSHAGYLHFFSKEGRHPLLSKGAETLSCPIVWLEPLLQPKEGPDGVYVLTKEGGLFVLREESKPAFIADYSQLKIINYYPAGKGIIIITDEGLLLPGGNGIKFPSRVNAGFLYDEENSVLVSNNKKTSIFSFDGSKLFESDLEPASGFEPVIYGNRLFIADSRHNLICFDFKNKKRVYSVRGGLNFSGKPVIKNGIIYLSNLDHNLYGFSINNGIREVFFKTRGPLYFNPLLSGKYIYLAPLHGNAVETFDTEKKSAGPTIFLRRGNLSVSPCIMDDKLIVVAEIEGGESVIYRFNALND